MIVHLE